MRSKAWLAGSAALLVAGCATAPRAPAVAPPGPPPSGAGPLPVPPPQPPVPWEDKAPTPGDWRFAQSPAAQADYGAGDAAALTLRCEVSQRRVLLVRTGAAAGTALTVRTTYGARRLPVGEGGVASLAAADPVLDEIAFSRGRFAVEALELPTLTLPAWPEPARVIEECRP